MDLSSVVCCQQGGHGRRPHQQTRWNKRRRAPLLPAQPALRPGGVGRGFTKPPGAWKRACCVAGKRDPHVEGGQRCGPRPSCAGAASEHPPKARPGSPHTLRRPSGFRSPESVAGWPVVLFDCCVVAAAWVHPATDRVCEWRAVCRSCVGGRGVEVSLPRATAHGAGQGRPRGMFQSRVENIWATNPPPPLQHSTTAANRLQQARASACGARLD